MKVFHIESGLGNQMLSYCELLAMSKMNPDEQFYIETIIYDIPECNEVTCQWNGYELERIFGINRHQNIKTIFSELQWAKIMDDIRKSEFWKYNMNYPVAFTKAFANSGLVLENTLGDFSQVEFMKGRETSLMARIRRTLVDTYVGNYLKRLNNTLRETEVIKSLDRRNRIFLKSDDDLFCGQLLALKFRGNDRELIDNEIKQTFRFPAFTDSINMEMSSFLDKSNSVAIHARRGDLLGNNGWCYKYGYFRRAVNHIRKNVANPVFVFFTDPGSIQWCRDNARTFGLDYSKDKVYFVDWNSGSESFRDMQLMSHCKHAIITTSSFGWWGAYFINNPEKITISPCVEIDTTYHC